MAIIIIWVFRNFGLIFNTFLWQMYAERGNQRVVWKKRFKKHFDVISRCWYKTISTGNLVAWLQSILLFVFANSLIAPNTMFHFAIRLDVGQWGFSCFSFVHSTRCEPPSAMTGHLDVPTSTHFTIFISTLECNTADQTIYVMFHQQQVTGSLFQNICINFLVFINIFFRNIAQVSPYGFCLCYTTPALTITISP